MKHDYDARHLNLEAFARGQCSLTGSEDLSQFERLLLEALGGGTTAKVHFSAQGLTRTDSGQGEQIWLTLKAEVDLPQTCQRCLGPVVMPVMVEREFRFVASEAQAEVEDEESEEDVLVLSRDFNLLELVEDELLMALPAVPKHAVCPAPVKLQVADPDFVEVADDKPNPFAVLQQLKGKH